MHHACTYSRTRSLARDSAYPLNGLNTNIVKYGSLRRHTLELYSVVLSEVRCGAGPGHREILLDVNRQGCDGTCGQRREVPLVRGYHVSSLLLLSMDTTYVNDGTD